MKNWEIQWPPRFAFQGWYKVRFKYRPRCGPAIITVCTTIQSPLQVLQHVLSNLWNHKLPYGHHQVSAFFFSQDGVSGAQISSVLPEWLYSEVRKDSLRKKSKWFKKKYYYHLL